MTAGDSLFVLADRHRDTRSILAGLAGSRPAPEIATTAQIVTAAAAGALGAAVITEDALDDGEMAALGKALAGQPSWSDSAILLLARRGGAGRARARLAGVPGNFTILERPVSADVLGTMVNALLRARARQRVAASQLPQDGHDDVIRRLHESEALHRFALALTGQTPWKADPQGRWSGPGSGGYGLSGSDWFERVHPEDLDALSSGWSEAIADALPFCAEFRLLGDEGDYSWHRLRAAPRLSPDGIVMQWYGTLKDIDHRRIAATKLRHMQARLLHVSSLSAMGTMASTLAHELNQPLTAITNYVRGSRRMVGSLPGNEGVLGALDAADAHAVRAGEIIRNVRELVAKGQDQRRPEDLSSLVREACTLAMADPQLSGIVFQLDLASQPISVMVDKIQVQQVLLNLLRNSADSMRGSMKRRIGVATTVSGQHYCEVNVHDSGAGLMAASPEWAFEPFNTTRADGLGVGLSISRTIIEAHGGTIWYRPSSTSGATFGFSLLTTSLRPVAPD